MELKLGFCAGARPTFSLHRNDRKSQPDFQLGAKRFRDLFINLRDNKMINPLLNGVQNFIGQSVYHYPIFMRENIRTFVENVTLFWLAATNSEKLKLLHVFLMSLLSFSFPL